MKRTRWPIVFASLVALTVGPTSILFYTQSLFLDPMTQEFGWTRVGYFSAVLVGGVAGTLATPVAGRLLDRFGVRRVLIAGIVLFALANAALGLIGGALPAYIALSALAAVAGVVQGPLSYAKAIAGWFDQRRGLALAVALSGTGLGGVFIPPGTAWLIAAHGWRGARFGLAALILLIALPTVILFVRERGHPGGIRTSKGADATQLEGVTLREAVRERSFWLLLVAFLLSSMVVNGVLANLLPLLLGHGSARSIATVALSALAVGQIAGRLLSGLLLDRVLTAKVGILWYGVATLGLGLIAMVSAPAAVLLACALVGAALGSELEMAAVFTSRFFGRRHFGTINGMIFAAYLLGAAAGPLLASLLVGEDGGGGRPIAVGIALLVVAALLLLATPPYRFPPVRDES